MTTMKSELTNGAPKSSPDERAVLALRNLLFDICAQNGGGHGGSAIGMAAIGVALYKYAMRYNPSNPDWFDRDRFVLSNGQSLPIISLHSISKVEVANSLIYDRRIDLFQKVMLPCFCMP
jgi:transketolase